MLNYSKLAGPTKAAGAVWAPAAAPPPAGAAAGGGGGGGIGYPYMPGGGPCGSAGMNFAVKSSIRPSLKTNFYDSDNEVIGFDCTRLSCDFQNK